jgi:hypothetical protein
MKPMKEVEYLESQIKGIREERGKLPTVFSDFQAGKEAEIRQIMEAAGIWQKVQMMHGIDISKLDWETRLKVMNGDKRTIEALGGTMADIEPSATPQE